MPKDVNTCTIQEIEEGYCQDERGYVCLCCKAQFDYEEIFPLDGRFYTAEKAIRVHLHTHDDRLHTLLQTSGRYAPFTENQRELLLLIAEGFSDKEIAERLGVAQSTVRHQKFTLREKAKQAKLFLAAFELATQQKKLNLLPIHEGAKMVDERFIITPEEEEKILTNAFISLEPLKLELFPVKEKKKIAVLRKILTCFEVGRTYTEKEVNAILKEIYSDYVTIRRYFIEYGYMDRTNDCASYWLR